MLAYSQYKLTRYQLQEFFGDNLIARACEDFVTQVHYWCGKGSTHQIGFVQDQSRYIYNTVESWARQLHIKKSTLERGLRLLKKEGIIETIKRHPKSSDQTHAYKLNYVRLIEMGVLRAPHVIADKIAGKPKVPADLELELPANPQNCSFRQRDGMYIDTIITEEEPSACARANNTSPHPIPSSPPTPQNLSKLENLEDIPPPSPSHDSLSQQMLDIWNGELYLKPSAHVHQLTPKQVTYLRTAYRSCFQSSLQAWKLYCQQIAHSPIVMKPTFELTLDWALNFKVIRRISVENAYGVPPVAHLRNRQEKEADSRKRALDHVLGAKESILASQMRKTIWEVVGSVDYLAWFSTVTISDDGTTLLAPSAFISDSITSRFGHRLPDNLKIQSKR